MKQDYPEISKKTLCKLFGKTRHAFYDSLWRREGQTFKDELILQLVIKVRERLPRLGTRKLLVLLRPELLSHHIDIGRDYLFDLLEMHKLLVRGRKRRLFTTDSRHWMRKYPNTAQSLVICRSEQLWVADMTYIKIMNNWGYLSLITDAYSRKIMGFCLRMDMLTVGCLEALQMALQGRIYPFRALTHHSDRGCQYCSKDYTDLLKSNEIKISMTEHGDPYENALAERINGILKVEFNMYGSGLNFDQTLKHVQLSIQAYNQIRPHSSCNNMTPEIAHENAGLMKRQWKNYKQSDQMEKQKPQLKFRAKPIRYGNLEEETVPIKNDT